VAELFNIYCDESCHLEQDNIPVMVLGAVWCKAEQVREIGCRIRELKDKHRIRKDFEIKWTKVSPAKKDFYLDLVDYFFDDDDLHFRGLLIPDKTKLDHQAFGQTHDSWYYKMCFRMLEPIIDPTQHYRVYLDIKDTRSEDKRKKLEDVLRHARGDRRGQIIQRMQQIRSHESPLLQLADLLIGAIGYSSRNLQGSTAKQELVQRIRKRSRWPLNRTTWLREPKFNLLCWLAQEGEQ